MQKISTNTLKIMNDHSEHVVQWSLFFIILLPFAIKCIVYAKCPHDTYSCSHPCPLVDHLKYVRQVFANWSQSNFSHSSGPRSWLLVGHLDYVIHSPLFPIILLPFSIRYIAHAKWPHSTFSHSSSPRMCTTGECKGPFWTEQKG